MSHPFRALFLPLLLLAGLASCASKPAVWVERELPLRSEVVLWQFSLAALRSAEYPVGLGADPSERRIESGWKTDLQPFRGEGTRERATIRFEPSEEGFLVSVRVERDINQDILRPLDRSYAKWEPSPDNEARANYLLQQIESRLETPFELGEDKPVLTDDIDGF